MGEPSTVTTMVWPAAADLRYSARLERSSLLPTCSLPEEIVNGSLSKYVYTRVHILIGVCVDDRLKQGPYQN